MGRIRRSFTIGFKQQVVMEIESRVISVSAACRKYQLTYGALRRWREKFGEGTLVEKPSEETLSLMAENEQLKVKVGELTMQIDLLKKFNALRQRKRNGDTCVITEKNLVQFKEAAKCSG
jgi:transposase-like protein